MEGLKRNRRRRGFGGRRARNEQERVLKGDLLDNWEKKGKRGSRKQQKEGGVNLNR